MTHTASASTAPALIRFLSAAQAAPVEPAAHRDRSRSVLLGLAVGNILGLRGEGRRSYEMPDRYPGGVIAPNPKEKDRPMDDDLAQAVELGKSLFLRTCVSLWLNTMPPFPGPALTCVFALRPCECVWFCMPFGFCFTDNTTTTENLTPSFLVYFLL